MNEFTHRRLAPNHPKQKLLFFVAQTIDESSRAQISEFVVSLASLRSWLNGPPQFVHRREEPEDGAKGTLPLETLGGYLEVFSAWPPWTLPREIDIQHLDEVTALANALQNFSRQHRIAFELELDGTFVGEITDGEPDRSLSDGFLGEWRRQLDSSTQAKHSPQA